MSTSWPRNDTFNEAVARFYEEHMVPMLFEPYATHLVTRLVEIEDIGAILEIAAGAGIVTRKIPRIPRRQTVPIVATDISHAMIALAATLSPETNITWGEADAAKLPFANASFDTVICQFGIMFVADKIKAYHEALRVLRPGGRFIFTVWDCLEKNDFAHTVNSVLSDMSSADPPDFLQHIPHGYHDTTTIAADLTRCGFAPRPSFDTIVAYSEAPNAATAARAYIFGTPLRNQIDARGTDMLERATSVVQQALVERFGSGIIRGRTRAYIGTAVRPSGPPGSSER